MSAKNSEHYDVIIIGRSVACLLTACLLAKRRLRVRVLDAPEDAGSEVPLFGMQTCPLLYTIMDELGLVHDLRTRLVAEPNGIGVILPDRRFTFEPEPKARALELAEVLPDSRSALLRLFETVETFGPSLDVLMDGQVDLTADGFRSRRKLQRALEACPAAELIDDQRLWSSDPLVRDLVHALLRTAGQKSGSGDYMTPSALRTLWHLCFGLPQLRRNRAGLQDMLIEKLRSSGGTMEDARRAASVDVRRRRVRSVETKDGARFGADYVVMAGQDQLSKLTGAELADDEVDHELTVSIPRSDKPRLLTDPHGWVTDAGHAYALRLDSDNLTVRWDAEAPSPNLKQLMPFADIAPSSTRARPGDPGERLDELGLFRQPVRSQMKNLVFVGETVLPGLGLESDCITAHLAAGILEQAATSRWPFGGNI